MFSWTSPSMREIREDAYSFSAPGLAGERDACFTRLPDSGTRFRLIGLYGSTNCFMAQMARALLRSTEMPGLSVFPPHMVTTSSSVPTFHTS